MTNKQKDREFKAWMNEKQISGRFNHDEVIFIIAYMSGIKRSLLHSIQNRIKGENGKD